MSATGSIREIKSNKSLLAVDSMNRRVWQEGMRWHRVKDKNGQISWVLKAVDKS
jgi:SH3-like domain-containing protein